MGSDMQRCRYHRLGSTRTCSLLASRLDPEFLLQTSQFPQGCNLHHAPLPNLLKRIHYITKSLNNMILTLIAIIFFGGNIDNRIISSHIFFIYYRFYGEFCCGFHLTSTVIRDLQANDSSEVFLWTTYWNKTQLKGLPACGQDLFPKANRIKFGQRTLVGRNTQSVNIMEKCFTKEKSGI